MITIWYFLLIALFGFTFGVILITLLYATYDFFKKRSLAKHIPQTKTPVAPTQPLKEQRATLADPGNIPINEKEVKDDEQRKFDRFREQERIRNIYNKNVARPVSKPATDITDLQRYAELQQRGILQDGLRKLPSPTKRESGTNSKKIEFNKRDA